MGYVLLLSDRCTKGMYGKRAYFCIFQTSIIIRFEE